jgi:hypothetical protein
MRYLQFLANIAEELIGRNISVKKKTGKPVTNFGVDKLEKAKEKYLFLIQFGSLMLVLIFQYPRLDEDVPTVALKIMNNDLQLQLNVRLAKWRYAFQTKEIAFTYFILIRIAYS